MTLKFLKKAHFTLLEVLIVLFILGIGAALTAIKIKDVYQEQRFLTEVQQITGHLQMAQDLMLIIPTDTYVKFYQDPETSKIKYRLDIKKELPPNWQKFIQKEYELSSVKSIYFNDTSLGRKEIEIQFKSKGADISEGKLIFSKSANPFSSDENSRESYQIDLLGYPHFIESEKYQKRVRSSVHSNPFENQKYFYPPQVFEELYEKPH